MNHSRVDTQSPGVEAVFQREIEQLAQKLFRRNARKRQQVIDRMLDYVNKAQGKEVLVIVSPGGWGNTPIENLQDWEKSIVNGVTEALSRLGRRWALAQYLRSGPTFWWHFRDLDKEAAFFFLGKSPRAEAMAEQLKLLTRILPDIKILLLAVSQGAAFDNAAMKSASDNPNIYSIELGTFFPQMPRRILSPRTLAIDSNGLQRDPMCERDLWAGTKSYIKAFSCWSRALSQGKKIKFTHCINTPGHEYKWEHPAVGIRIVTFLTTHFGWAQVK
jgi:hypothetical protein